MIHKELISYLERLLIHHKAYEKETPGVFVKWQKVVVCVRDAEIEAIREPGAGGYLMVGCIEGEDRGDLGKGQACFLPEGEVNLICCAGMTYATFEAIEGSRDC